MQIFWRGKYLFKRKYPCAVFLPTWPWYI